MVVYKLDDAHVTDVTEVPTETKTATTTLPATATATADSGSVDSGSAVGDEISESNGDKSGEMDRAIPDAVTDNDNLNFVTGEDEAL